jgi:pimeloyl-ACP methyl ester carboxylesterase/DNA-binding winged helix-turn-helix (wHTH) protein
VSLHFTTVKAGRQSVGRLSYSGRKMGGASYLFDRFRLDVRERRFWRDDKPVPLRDKVFDTLVLLVEGAGRLQTQQELIDRLWPDVSVEPNNLQHNVSILRKALAGSPVQIETLRGRGYRLVAEVRRQSDDGAKSASTSPRTASHDESSKHQTIHFCRTPDDVGLAWAELGEGPPLVKAGNWCSHLELDRWTPVWRHIMDSLSSKHRLIRYDARGNGLSDSEVQEVSFERWVSDLETVVDAAGLDRFPLIGISQGASVAAAYAARHPERVSALVLICGLVRGWRVKALPQVTRHFEALLSLMEGGWGQDNAAFRQIFSTAFFPDASKEELDGFNELQRRSATPQNAIRMLSTIGDIDLRSEVSRVRAPTLVIHGRNDLVIPFSDGKELASGISGARFVPLETKNHIPLADDPAWGRMESEIQGFLGAHA